MNNIISKITTPSSQSSELSMCSNDIFKSDIIKKALSLSEDKQLTEIELAELMGFSSEEIAMIQVFWQYTFNRSWIYLSDEMILEYLTNDSSKYAIRDFYKRILLSNYIEGIDYIEVSKDNEVVKFWWANSLTNNSNRRVANNKKYYLVTGETYKHLLLQSNTEKGKQTRIYYLKVENLAITMKDYIFELMNFQYQQQLKLQENEMKKLHDNHQQLLKKRSRTVYDVGNVVYIISNSSFEGQKFGKSSQVKKETFSAFMSRLSTYNTGSPHDFKVEYLIYLEENEHLEDALKIRYEKNLCQLNKEWVKDVSIKKMVQFIREYCEILDIEYKEYVYADIDEQIAINVEEKKGGTIDNLESDIKEVEIINVNFVIRIYQANQR